VADRQTLFEAIVDDAIAAGGAACADLQLYDGKVGVLRIVAQRGFGREFLAYFATVNRTGPSACALVLATGEAVLADYVSRSPIFTGQASRDAALAAGSRAVYCYPLLTPAGDLLAVLSSHRRTPADRPGNGAFIAPAAPPRR
jgi:hypothetical protein